MSGQALRIAVVGFHGRMADGGETPSLHELVLARLESGIVDRWYCASPDDLESTVPFVPDWAAGTPTPYHAYRPDWIVLVTGTEDRITLDGLRPGWRGLTDHLRTIRDARIAHYGPRELLTELRDTIARDVRQRLIALAWRDLALSVEQPTLALLEALGEIEPGSLRLARAMKRAP